MQGSRPSADFHFVGLVFHSTLENLETMGKTSATLLETFHGETKGCIKGCHGSNPVFSRMGSESKRKSKCGQPEPAINGQSQASNSRYDWKVQWVFGSFLLRRSCWLVYVFWVRDSGMQRHAACLKVLCRFGSVTLRNESMPTAPHVNTKKARQAAVQRLPEGHASPCNGLLSHPLRNHNHQSHHNG